MRLNSQDKIVIRGAKVNNLKNINLEIPKNKLTVITGISGSGKTSLAFDTIYAEGQRRYLESLSNYARQILGILDKPEVEEISGLSPTIAINQRMVSRSSRSTVGTITEIYDYLRLLFSRIGCPYCPKCGRRLQRQSISQMTEKIVSTFSAGSEILVLAPIFYFSDKPKSKENFIAKIKAAGYIKVRYQHRVYSLKELRSLSFKKEKDKKISLEVVIDKIKIPPERRILIKALKTALDLGNGLVKIVSTKKKTKELIFSNHYFCPKCNFILSDLQPRFFSFNSPYGACPECQGLGEKLRVDPQLVIPNKNLTISQGAIRPWTRMGISKGLELLKKVAQKYNFSLNVPVKKLRKNALKIILYGTGKEKYLLNNSLVEYKGVIADLEERYQQANSDYLRKEIEKYMRVFVCPKCKGKRLKEEVLAVKIGGKNIAQISEMSISQARKFLEKLLTSLREKKQIKEYRISSGLIKKIINQLLFLEKVGLDYLSLSRSSLTLAGGEAQRIKLASQLSTSLSGIIYILDEPTIGLHSLNVENLLKTIKQLVKKENTAIVVEHDREIISSADKVIDLGPGAGKYGGKIVAQGTPQEIKKNKDSLTGAYLSGRLKIDCPSKVRKGNNKKIIIKKAAAFNLKNIDVEIPLGKFVCLTGVSGSGKSTLMIEILAKALAKKFYRAKETPGKHQAILGIENIDKVVIIDQSPIGRSPHSNPATYTGVFSYIREIFAQTTEAKIRGYTPGHFSFNVVGGRCETCKGEGMIKVEMSFLPPVYIKCEDCNGTRYRPEILEVHYKNKNIAQVLDMSIKEARNFFADNHFIKNKLDILCDVGLGYLKLGQPAPTLSGGEAQRIKLAAELSRKSTGKTLYLLDEPTIGLHFEDIKRLLKVLNKLVDAGNTVLVIEHDLDVIKCADWIIDLGPGGGENGGYLVAQGTPHQVAKNKKSYTGRYLKKVLSLERKKR